MKLITVFALVCWLVPTFLLRYCDAQIQDSEVFVDVKTECPESSDQPAVVTIHTDNTESYPYAVCWDEYVYEFEQIGPTTWQLQVVFESEVPWDECVFVELSGDTFQVDAHVPEPDNLYGPMFGDDPPIVIRCNMGTEEPPKVHVYDSKQPFELMMSNMGGRANSDVQLEVVDILDRPVNIRLRLGRYVRINAYLIGNYSDEVGLQTVACTALGDNDASYDILIGGCGDGTVMGTDVGFTTDGKMVYSPYFRAFRMETSVTIAFNCTFVVCDSGCDGDSCKLAKKKRSIPKRDVELNKNNHNRKNEEVQKIEPGPHTRRYDMGHFFNSSTFTNALYMDKMQTTFVMVAFIPLIVLLMFAIMAILLVTSKLLLLLKKLKDRSTEIHQNKNGGKSCHI